MSEAPILVGVAQVEQHIAEYTEDAKEPLDLMIEAARAAGEDAGSTQALTDASSVRVIRGWWPYKNPGKVVAEALGIPNAETGITPYGGNMVQSTVSRSCVDIQAGKHDVILIVGGECGYTSAKARKQGVRPTWQEAPGTPDLFIGEEAPMSNDFEIGLGMRAATLWYPIFETALRARNGEALDDHVKRISELWSRFSAVAATNPNAWFQDAVSAEEIRTLSATNRPISYPYPKLMNSNNSVDMGAALILTSTTKARQLGIDEALWVYPHVGTDAHDTYFVSNRDNLYSSPAIRTAGNRALDLAGWSVDEIDHVDLYSCFPVAVQVAANELGLDQKRPLTVTGGLTFNGGPLNDYVMHSIARMVDVLRAAPGDKGLVTANGGMLTKHAFGVYSTEPPGQPFQYQDVQSEVDEFPTRELAEGHVGEVSIEGLSVMYGADGLDTAYVACLTPERQSHLGEDTGQRRVARHDPRRIRRAQRAGGRGSLVDGLGTKPGRSLLLDIARRQRVPPRAFGVQVSAVPIADPGHVLDRGDVTQTQLVEVLDLLRVVRQQPQGSVADEVQ